MSAPKHTPEPWNYGGSITGCGFSTYINAAGGGVIGSAGDHDTRCGGLHVMYASRFYNDDPAKQAQANAARIVACVNACAGMADPADHIERLKDLAHGVLPESLPTIRAQRDELAAVLRTIEKALSDQFVSSEILDENSPIRDAMRDALAKVPP